MICSIVMCTDPLLKQPCTEIPPKTEWWNLWQDLWDTLRYQKGLGLSCPQIGKRWRAFMCDGVLCIAPKLLRVGSSTSIEEEGCLSIPNVWVPVERSDWIRCQYISREGDKVTKKLIGLMARVWLHEFDHLNGVLITDYLKMDDK